jgi:hypothetical protein
MAGVRPCVRRAARRRSDGSESVRRWLSSADRCTLSIAVRHRCHCLTVQAGPIGCRLRPRGAKDWNGALELRGAKALRAHLAAFSETADDELRVNTAYDLLRNGRAELAWFLISLLEDVQTRELVRARMRQREQLPIAQGESRWT